MFERLPLRESLFLGFCAIFILLTRVLFRLRLGVSGHVMLFTVLFLMIARGCVAYTFAATFTALLAGVGAMVLGIGQGGPLLLLRFVLPGLAIDIGAFIFPRMFQSYLLCALVGAVASSTKAIATFAVDLAVGMNKVIILQHAVYETAAAVLFGVAGGLFVPQIIKRLKSHGVIQGINDRSQTR
jgi:hypothetical protein